MEMFRKSLLMTEAENRKALEDSASFCKSKFIPRVGNCYGNRHERRLAAGIARRVRKHEVVR